MTKLDEIDEYWVHIEKEGKSIEAWNKEDIKKLLKEMKEEIISKDLSKEKDEVIMVHINDLNKIFKERCGV